MTSDRSSPRPDRPQRGRAPVLLIAALAVTVLVLILDLGRPSWTDPLRSAAAQVAGPVQRALTGLTDTRVTDLTQERNELAARVAELEAERQIDADLSALADGSSWGSGTLLPSRVVGFAGESRPVASRTVAIDVGTADGVQVGQTVVDVDGLVGRVTRVETSGAVVEVLGDDQVVVGVRFGPDGALGTVVSGARPVPGAGTSASAAASREVAARGPDDLTLIALGDTTPEPGDEVFTLGSPDGTPYAAQVPVGVVGEVDPPGPTEQFGATAVVRPYVDLDTLDLVAVMLDPGRR